LEASNIWKNHKGQFSTYQILKDKIIYKKKKQMRGWIILNRRAKLKRKINFRKELKEETTQKIRIEFLFLK
jgi:hypothetical protein